MRSSRRNFVGYSLGGLAPAGLASVFPGLALAQPSPKRGGTLVYANCSANRRGGDVSNSKHPYYMVDLITRSAYNSLLWVDTSLQLQGELRGGGRCCCC